MPLLTILYVISLVLVPIKTFGDESPSFSNSGVGITPSENAQTMPTHPPSPHIDGLNYEVKDNDRFYSQFANMLFTLVLIIGLIFVISWILKRVLNTRLQQINETSEIKIIEKRSLSPKTSLFLLKIRDKEIIISESHNGVTLLGCLEKIAIQQKPSFDDLMQQKEGSSK